MGCRPPRTAASLQHKLRPELGGTWRPSHNTTSTPIYPRGVLDGKVNSRSGVRRHAGLVRKWAGGRRRRPAALRRT